MDEPHTGREEERQLGTESMSVDELRGQLDALIDRAVRDWERVVLTRCGEQLVAIIPAEELRWIEEFEDRREAELAAAAIEEAKGQPTIPWEKIPGRKSRQNRGRNHKCPTRFSSPRGRADSSGRCRARAQQRLQPHIDALADNPRPAGVQEARRRRFRVQDSRRQFPCGLRDSRPGADGLPDRGWGPA